MDKYIIALDRSFCNYINALPHYYCPPTRMHQKTRTKCRHTEAFVDKAQDHQVPTNAILFLGRLVLLVLRTFLWTFIILSRLAPALRTQQETTFKLDDIKGERIESVDGNSRVNFDSPRCLGISVFLALFAQIHGLRHPTEDA